MSTKQIADPRPVPEFRGDMQAYARELALYLETHLREVNQELDRLHDVKADA